MRRLALYPFLLPLWLLLTMKTGSQYQLHPAALVRPAALAMLCTALVFVVLQRLLRCPHKAALPTAAAMLLSMGLGGVALLMELRRGQPLAGSDTSWLLVVGTVGWALCTIFVHRVHLNFAGFTVFANWIVVGLTIGALLGEARAEWRLNQPWPVEAMPVTEPTPQSSLAVLPDIYYIVPDSYARSDHLKGHIGYDNSELIASLRALGFVVADQSQANYAETALSLASSLNMTYLDAVVEALGPDATDREPLVRMIHHNAVIDTLRDQGYTIVAFETGYRLTEITTADHYLGPPPRGLDTAEAFVLQGSALALLANGLSPLGTELAEATHLPHLDRVLYTLDQLPEIAAIPGPKFVFAHIVFPHPPLVLDAEGVAVVPDGIFSYRHRGSFASYLEGQADQHAYLDRVLPTIVGRLIADAQVLPIVIVQSDTGPSYLGEEVRLGILNALFLPQASPDQMHRAITPVNTFRLVFDHIFGTDLDSLPDVSFYSASERPYDMTPWPPPMSP